MRQRGFTLLELLVAISLMSVLALLSYRGLTAILDARTSLVSETDDLRAITLGFAQLDDDLLRSYPVKDLLKLQEPSIRIEQQGMGSDMSVSLVLLREVNRTGVATRIQRVVWQVRDGQLARGFGEWSQLAADGVPAGGAVRSMFWQPVITNVKSIDLRAYVDGRGWVDLNNLGRANSADGTGTRAVEETRRRAESAAQAPNVSGTGGTGVGQIALLAGSQKYGGIEMILTRGDGQKFVRLFSVRD